MIYHIFIVAISIYIVFMDIRYRRIPDAAVSALVLVGFCYMLNYQSYSHHITGGVIIPLVVFGVGFMLAVHNIIGMGDIKLLSVTLLLCPAPWQPDIIYFVIFSGGVWALMWHFLLTRISMVFRIDTVKEGIPYGIPIAAALCLFTFIR
ncbi:prepilin peptidase [Enterobacteriaceae bacterium BIT-l23]|uniref:A24 family peptidase n=1 Tax=Jejubacter sp. L23 TaxID=3092086 RepID=UPI001584BB03|nr:prepilin peptidase [Enterobacteriaceae bacterium BIT-l23]